MLSKKLILDRMRKIYGNQIVLYPLYFSEMKKQIVRRNKSPKYRNRKNDLSSGFPEDILMRTRENISRGVKLVKCKNYLSNVEKKVP